MNFDHVFKRFPKNRASKVKRDCKSICIFVPHHGFFGWKRESQNL